VAGRAKNVDVQIPTDAAAAGRGLSHYRENCLGCHGAPGIERPEFVEGMNPAPPPIEAPGIQRHTDGELFWIIKHGIRMTGMPAFGVNHTDEEIRDILAFVRHIPNLDAAEKQQLTSRVPDDSHHDHKLESRGGAGERFYQ
jgi:mono/diheme cytochrome c family protein